MNVPGLKYCAPLGVALLVLSIQLVGDEYKSGIDWPEPKIVNPGPVGGPPSDAIVLFDGKKITGLEGTDNWIIADGAATINKGAATTKQSFGDCQMHIEWATPAKVEGEGQLRGNSGIFMMGKYELQILDSYDNKTYYDGQAGSVYKQVPPLVNVCRKPGEWQTYDIIFTAPRFDSAGKLVKPAYITALQNGVLIQNHYELTGETYWDLAPFYKAHAEKLPILIQDHGNPLRVRNIWIREL